MGFQHVVSELADKNLEERIIQRARNASQKTGINFECLVMLKFKTLQKANQQNKKIIKLQDIEIPITAFYFPLSILSVDTNYKYIFFICGLPGAGYSEPIEEKLAHELLHIDYDERNLKMRTKEIIEKVQKRNTKSSNWLRYAIETLVNASIDGYVGYLYGRQYEEEIKKYCEVWMREVVARIQEIKTNNFDRIIQLFQASNYYARVPSHKEKICSLMKKLTSDESELKNVLLSAELYQEAFEKGKLGIKLEKVDIDNFIKEFFKRRSK